MASGRQKIDQLLKQLVRCTCCGAAEATPHQKWQQTPDGFRWRFWETDLEQAPLTGCLLVAVPCLTGSDHWVGKNSRTPGEGPMRESGIVFDKEN